MTSLNIGFLPATRHRHAARAWHTSDCPINLSRCTMHSLRSVADKIGAHAAIALYFGAPSCTVCQALKPKLLGAIQAEFPDLAFESIDCSATPDIPAQYGVFTVPTLLVFVHGKEVVRKSRHMSVGEVIEAIRRPYRLFR